MEQILVVQSARLGDFIQSTSLLANLRRGKPEAKIFLLAVEPSVLEAARLSSLVDQVLDSPEDAADQGFFEEVYSLNFGMKTAKMVQLVNGGQYFGPRLDKGKLVYPPAHQLLMRLMMVSRTLGRFNLVDILCALMPGSEPLPTMINCKPGQNNLTSQVEGTLIGMQLGCCNNLRRWPVEHFVSLGEELIRNGLDFTPVLLGSKDERALAKKFISLWGGKKVLDLIGSTDLQSLAETVESLDLLISNDTGVMHLGAALGRSVLALFFGPAYGPETGPYGDGHLIYQAAAPCSPCLEVSKLRHRQCMEMPKPEIVAVYAKYLLNGESLNAMVSPGLPQNHRVWGSSACAFGQNLFPIGMPSLSSNEALALLLTEASRSVVRPSYEMDAGSLIQLLSFYKNVDDCSIDLDGISKRIFATAACFPESSINDRVFMADVYDLAAKVGLNIERHK